MLEGYSIAREVTKVTLDCTHHDCRRMSPGVVAQILGDKLEMGPSVLGRHILCYQLAGRQPGTGPGLSVEPSARPGRLERDLIDQPEGPPPGRSTHSGCIQVHYHIPPAVGRTVGSGSHCHILPGGRLGRQKHRFLPQRILGLRQVRLLMVHSIASTGVSWKSDTLL